MMKLDLWREATIIDTTFARLEINGATECYTLEDKLREIPGKPVSQWKLKNATAIPAGVYDLAIRSSPRFGPETIWLKNVPGYDYVEVHGGNSDLDTDGCLIVGDQIDRKTRRIFGAKTRGVLDQLKAKLVPMLKSGQRVQIEIHNPLGYAGPDLAPIDAGQREERAV